MILLGADLWVQKDANHVHKDVVAGAATSGHWSALGFEGSKARPHIMVAPAAWLLPDHVL
jgi:hypothetical protein